MQINILRLGWKVRTKYKTKDKRNVTEKSNFQVTFRVFTIQKHTQTFLYVWVCIYMCIVKCTSSKISSGHGILEATPLPKPLPAPPPRACCPAHAYTQPLSRHPPSPFPAPFHGLLDAHVPPSCRPQTSEQRNFRTSYKTRSNIAALFRQF